MRVEQTKNKAAENKESNFKTEKSVFDSSGRTQTANITNAPKPGAFERILSEAREQTGKNEKTAAAKSDSSESAAKTSEAEEKKEANRKEEEKVKSQDKNKGESGGEQGNDDENSAVYANRIVSAGAKSAPEVSAPAARSILHVADLERIVSFVRAQTSGDGQQQLMIALKNSVLDGLQIRLTSDQNGNVKAEFLALNEKIRKQLKARKGELSEILKQRSNKFTEVKILLLED